MKGKINMDLATNGDKNKQFGSVTTKSGSNKLYVNMRYHGIRIVKSTGLENSEENRKKIRGWLDNVDRKIQNGTFKFAEAFPGASENEKSHFARLEGWSYTAKPNEVFFGDYSQLWRKRILDNETSETKKRDHNQILDYWVIPKFANMTFFQINGVVLKEWILKELRHRKGKKKGRALSQSRIGNILIPFRQIYEDACIEYNWSLFNPFVYWAKENKGPKKTHINRTVFLYDQFAQIIDKFDPYYRDHTLMMLHTGMIGSELAGLRKSDIVGDEIWIQNSIVRKIEKTELKTEYRHRQFPITQAVRKILDRAIAKANGEYLFTMKSGRHFDVDSYRKNVWTRALEMANIIYQVPYTLRHTFAAWLLTIEIDKNRLVYLMGHGSKKMVYEDYGKYVKNLEKDKDKILRFFGEDFIGQGAGAVS